MLEARIVHFLTQLVIRDADVPPDVAVVNALLSVVALFPLALAVIAIVRS